MSSRELWALSVPLAVLGWVGLAVVTAFLPFSPVAALIALPILLLAVTFTAAPIIWLVARRLRLPGPGGRPVIALRVAFWLGLWAATAAGLQLFDAFSWLVAITLAVIFGLIEGFLQQQSQS